MNILVTGTPGTGKTTLCTRLSKITLKPFLECSKIVQKHKFYTKKDLEFDSLVTNEDDLLDYLEEQLLKNSAVGCIVESHSAASFPLRWFQLVVCLRANTDTLYDRLLERGYKANKVQENVESEIMGICLEDVQEFDQVVELHSNSEDDMARNCDFISREIAMTDQFASESSSHLKESESISCSDQCSEGNASHYSDGCESHSDVS